MLLLKIRRLYGNYIAELPVRARLKIKYEELFISRFIKCKDSLNEHSPVNIYRLYLPSNAQVIFNRVLRVIPYLPASSDNGLFLLQCLEGRYYALRKGIQVYKHE